VTRYHSGMMPIVSMSLSSWPESPLPAWASAGPTPAFQAGAALLALDQVVRAEPPWIGALRMRQALTAAAASSRLLGQREGAEALRDAQHLIDAGADPGPAGRLHRAWRSLADRPAALDDAMVERLCAGLGLPATALPPLAAAEDDQDPITAASYVAAGVLASRGNLAQNDAEILGLMVADLILARRLRWRVALPLLAAAITHPAFKRDGRRPVPGEPGWEASCYAGYGRAAAEAHRRALDLSRRYDRFRAAAGQVRTRNRDPALKQLLDDDAMAPSELRGLGSDRAARRFCERLVALGALRELSGRAAFRLYGL